MTKTDTRDIKATVKQIKKLEKIGDTLRVSLSVPPEEEVKAAWEILKSFQKMAKLSFAIFWIERVTGVEPVSRLWKSRIIAVILYPLI